MKRTILLSLSIAAFAALASATTVSCTITAAGPLTAYSTSTSPFANTAFDIANGTTGGTITDSINCPSIDAGAGNVITDFSVLATGDYTGGPFGTTSGTEVDLTFSTTASSPIGVASQVVQVLGGNSSTTDVPPTPFAVGVTVFPNVETTASFNVAINSVVVSGAVGDASGQVVLSYDTAPAGVPEPETMGLVGSALLAIGLIARKRK